MTLLERPAWGFLAHVHSEFADFFAVAVLDNNRYLAAGFRVLSKHDGNVAVLVEDGFAGTGYFYCGTWLDGTARVRHDHWLVRRGGGVTPPCPNARRA